MRAGIGPKPNSFPKEHDSPDPAPDTSGGGETRTKSKASVNTTGYKTVERSSTIFSNRPGILDS